MVSPSGTAFEGTAQGSGDVTARALRERPATAVKGGMRQPTSRLSLLGRFSLMSLAVIATLGLAIGLTLKRQIEQRALARASQLAEVVAELGVRPRLERDDLVGALPAKRIRALDAALR